MKRTFAGMLAAMLACAMLAAPVRAAYDASADTGAETVPADQEAQDEGELPALEEESVVDADEMASAAGLNPEEMQDDFSALWGVTGPTWEEDTADEVDGIVLFGEEAADETDGTPDYIFLSDRDYEPDSKAGHGSLMQNLAPNGKTIQLLVNGTPTEFEKGMGAHATSTLIYEIGRAHV